MEAVKDIFHLLKSLYRTRTLSHILEVEPTPQVQFMNLKAALCNTVSFAFVPSIQQILCYILFLFLSL